MLTESTHQNEKWECQNQPLRKGKNCNSLAILLVASRSLHSRGKIPEVIEYLEQLTVQSITVVEQERNKRIKMVSSYLPTKLGMLPLFVLAALTLLRPAQSFTPLSPLATHSKVSPLVLYGKKNKRKGGGGGGGGGQQPRQEKQSVKDQRFDAATRQFMFTLSGLSKMLPDKSKKILDNIHLSFYPGAKIGIVGLNGSGYAVRRGLIHCPFEFILLVPFEFLSFR